MHIDNTLDPHRRRCLFASGASEVPIALGCPKSEVCGRNNRTQGDIHAVFLKRVEVNGFWVHVHCVVGFDSGNEACNPPGHLSVDDLVSNLILWSQFTDINAINAFKWRDKVRFQARGDDPLPVARDTGLGTREWLILGQSSGSEGRKKQRRRQNSAFMTLELANAMLIAMQ
jgi:hypothetical protein